MNRRKWLLAALLAVPLAVSGVIYANVNKADPPKSNGFTCPITGEQLPCSACCPLNQDKQQAQPYTCPVTGEELPCPACCPLNSEKATATAYICPLTGEELSCAGCCPLNDTK